MLLIFDVDGTLTPSRSSMDEGFKRWMLDEMEHPFVLVTGSDPDKTREQIGDELYNTARVYNCAGNHVFDRGVEVRRSGWRIPSDLEDFLNRKLEESPWEQKTGKHIEHRIGLCNFSVVGRNASKAQRAAYYAYDLSKDERRHIANEIKVLWPNIEASVAGETGMDIYAIGKGKDQILEDLVGSEPLHFFGDRMDPEGNDHRLSLAILDAGLGECHHVSGWEETWAILKGLQ